jgi:hypothetical protein
MIKVETAPSPEAGYVREKQTSVVFPTLAIGSRIEVKTRATRPARNPGHFHLVRIPPLRQMRLDVYEETVKAPEPMHWKVFNMDGFTITPLADARQLSIRLDAPRFRPVVRSGGTDRIHDEPRIEIADTDQMDQQFKRVAHDFEQVIEGPLPPNAAKFVLTAPSSGAGAHCGNHAVHSDELSLFWRLAVDRPRYAPLFRC